MLRGCITELDLESSIPSPRLPRNKIVLFCSQILLCIHRESLHHETWKQFKKLLLKKIEFFMTRSDSKHELLMCWQCLTPAQALANYIC